MSSAATPSTQTVLSLYRSYLRVINKWPTDPIRPTRNMKTALRSQVMESFRSPLNATAGPNNAADTLASRVADARVQLEALQKIAQNEFKQKYPLSSKLLTPASNPNYYSKLVDMLEKETAKKNIEAIGKKGPTFFQKLFRTAK
ncbi:hypothetical protein BX616_008965 [Lobosporangium transversale]|uniref:Mitochondrial protein M19 n=1 Tax=Lobosporangium transversale TaxID=64571 RepID=A0A1Y2GW05_9FUNG|nr:hypothetical protein BCR41DRAFT_349839 [Lobosporangium transversale]KAF9918405.1 hypothetical protein BX616_008965 [Lobosporangium transversale]ORZ22884.1 hypothetical protein BCR41DRAFT_349839 [Lobosporangium transversale]|eukprot:XP_021883438.1 hypothetical protein BCR41DRAFT_349839 [Lobosporangium transversale]